MRNLDLLPDLDAGNKTCNYSILQWDTIGYTVNMFPGYFLIQIYHQIQTQKDFKMGPLKCNLLIYIPEQQLSIIKYL